VPHKRKSARKGPSKLRKSAIEKAKLLRLRYLELQARPGPFTKTKEKMLHDLDVAAKYYDTLGD
jgi:hypothetical protein